MVEDDDLRGITSNPAIFDKGITSGHEYDEILERELRRDPTSRPATCSSPWPSRTSAMPPT